MVVKKSKLIGVALLLALSAATLSSSVANEGNNLVQLDLKRSSNDSVNVTLFTSNTYNDNVLVRKKSDNKYVILIPKVQSNGFSSSSLNGVKDLVSNIDVKTVNDTSGGYTKVTLITTKPLDIKTNTQKSILDANEQKEYKTLIAQANAVKNNVAKPVQAKKQAPKTEITVNKSNTTVKNTQEQKTNSSVQKQINKPKIELKEISPEIVERQNRREHLAELINEAKQDQLEKHVPSIPLQEVKQPVENNQPVDMKYLPKENNINVNNNTPILSTVKQNAKKLYNKIPNKAKKPLAGVLGVIMLMKILGMLFKNSNNQRTNYAESNVPANGSSNNKYSNIVNNKSLSWQEKYQMYLDESAKPVSRGKNKGSYTFIKKPAAVDELNQKRTELEKLLEEMPLPDEITPEIVEVQSEEDSIQNTIKFKAFDRKKSLNTTSRDRIKSRFKKYEKEIPLHEQKNVDLGSSPLHSNPRSLKNANLNIEDVDKSRIKFKHSEYIMSSVDEYFSILDKEEQQNKITNEPVKIEQPIQKPEIQTNPIEMTHKNTKQDYLNNLIIKSGFNIDENKGFYMVNLDGKSSLIGKVNDDIFVLKKFNKNISKPIQVRKDKNNVYMVKTEGFKSLVEVDNNKMGVLIEL